MPPEAANAGLAALERLRRIVEAVRGTDDGAWLATVLDVHEANAPAGARFDETIRLAPGPGQQPWWSAQRRAERDAAIKQLADTFLGPPTSRALAAAEEIRRHAGTGWRHDRVRGGPLTSDVRRGLLYAILTIDEAPPMSMRRVYDIALAGNEM